MFKRIVFIGESQYTLPCEVEDTGKQHLAHFGRGVDDHDSELIRVAPVGTQVEIWYDDLIFSATIGDAYEPANLPEAFYTWRLDDVEVTPNENQGDASASLDSFLNSIEEVNKQLRDNLMDKLQESFGSVTSNDINDYLGMVREHAVIELESEDETGTRYTYVRGGEQIAFRYADDPVKLGFFNYINPSVNFDDLATTMWFLFEKEKDEVLMDAERFATEVQDVHREDGLSGNPLQHAFANAFAAYINVKNEAKS